VGWVVRVRVVGWGGGGGGVAFWGGGGVTARRYVTMWSVVVLWCLLASVPAVPRSKGFGVASIETRGGGFGA